MNDVASISLVAALLAGLAGSGHCFAMCGGMAGALGMRAAKAETGSARMVHTLLYQTGRLSGYAMAGALCGWLGSSLQLVSTGTPLFAALRIGSGILILLVAVRLALRWNLLGWLERLGARLWTVIRPVAARSAGRVTKLDSLTLGLLWGWLPCGLVYSMLLFAALSHEALAGAAIMIAYGLGTMPSMLGTSLFAGQLQSVLTRPLARTASAVLLSGFGLWMIVAAALPNHSIAGLYCLN